VVSGTARVTRDAEVYVIGANESTYIPVATRHRLENAGGAGSCGSGFSLTPSSA